MRTQDEIVKRIDDRKPKDMFGFEWHEYIGYLDLEHAVQYLKDDHGMTTESWSKDQADQGDIRTVMIDYMPFAFEKANNCRGISAGRSISHYVAWLWIEGTAEAESLSEKIQDYDCYGKPQLEMICEHLGINPKEWDDGVRGNSEEECEAQLG